MIDKFVCNSITWGEIQYSRNFGAQNKIDYNSGYTVTLFAADDVDFLFGIGWESLLPSLSISVIITAGRTASIIVGHNIGSSRLYWCLQTKNASEKPMLHKYRRLKGKPGFDGWEMASLSDVAVVVIGSEVTDSFVSAGADTASAIGVASIGFSAVDSSSGTSS